MNSNFSMMIYQCSLENMQLTFVAVDLAVPWIFPAKYIFEKMLIFKEKPYVYMTNFQSNFGENDGDDLEKVNQ